MLFTPARHATAECLISYDLRASIRDISDVYAVIYYLPRRFLVAAPFSSLGYFTSAAPPRQR